MSKLFLDLLGQSQAKELLLSSLIHRKIAPAYLFYGPKGVGRTIGVLRFLEGLLSGIDGNASLRSKLTEHNYTDMVWIEPTCRIKGELVSVSELSHLNVYQRTSIQIRLQQIKQALTFLSEQPLEGPLSIAVIEHSELMSEGASNALLKTLEDPGRSIFILITDTPAKIPTTIRSRCQHVPFVSLDRQTFNKVVDLKIERATSYPPELLELAAGSPGSFIYHIRQWQSLPNKIAERLLKLTMSSLEILNLARDLSETLDHSQQIWLLNWWQWQLWNRHFSIDQQAQLELLRTQLTSYVDARLAWEVALLEIRLTLI
uniref:DNA polymerase III subunit delta n=1 Tax=Paulinella micropora TaxID=1928728 RepID=A0A385HZZ7_9EUKA|nr:DNA polymerase III subunit delta [Paulinella micropora]AXY63243.1 DNA polymerase III subunit delta [Paulinella micropora]